MKSWTSCLVLCVIFACGLLLTATAQTAAGMIKVGKVQGEALRVFADGRPAQQLKPGDMLTESDTITTGKESLAVLVFMNGSSVKVGADSKLRIEEFKMDPLGEDISAAKLDREPSKSKTTLDLQFGEMVGDVKKLNYEAGSSFKIKTPVGAAGIRGTTFRIVFRPTGDGRTFTFQLATAEGNVAFEGTAQVPANLEVLDQKEIVVVAEVSVDPTTGAVTVTSVTLPNVTQPISADNKAVIEVVAAQVISESVQATNFTTSEQNQPPSGNEPGSTNPPQNENSPNNTEQQQSNNSPQQPNPPPPTQRQNQLTGGAGKT
jgi:hypothetical protein